MGVKANATAPRKELIKLLQASRGRHDMWRIWSDWVEMCAISISNAVDLAQRPEREARYLQIVKAYEADELQRFSQALAALVMVLEDEGFGDVLGSVFMELELGSKWAGQFFTPYSLCLMMAHQILGDEAKATIEARGFITVNDPAVGGGAMPVAMANALHDQGINYQQHLHITCQDVDLKAVHMAYVQLSLLHVPAVVIHGNTLKVEALSHWYTPAHIVGGWTYKLRGDRAHIETEPATAAVAEPAQASLFDALEAA